MGIEIVELTMQLEEEFEINIPDEDSYSFKTVGDITNYLSSRKYPDQEYSEEKVFKILQNILMKRFNIPKDDIKRKADLFNDIGLD